MILSKQDAAQPAVIGHHRGKSAARKTGSSKNTIYISTSSVTFKSARLHLSDNITFFIILYESCSTFVLRFTYNSNIFFTVKMVVRLGVKSKKNNLYVYRTFQVFF